jgi:ubiquinone/menaquinone biosynthesis C-methylase UbiE
VGAWIGSIEERFPGYDILGFDVDNEMLRTARDRLGGQFTAGDARTLPIRNGEVDTVFFVATLEFIPAVETVPSEAVRVLRPGGRLVALVLNTKSSYVRLNLQREGSYFQQMVHRDSTKLASLVEDYVHGQREYFLGIRDRTVFESDDPSEAALVAISGHSLSYRLTVPKTVEWGQLSKQNTLNWTRYPIVST